jgi:outer membrane receptor protein involved in Fe transport
VQHVFSGLPGVFSGLGIQAGYNYADTDFETADPTVVSGDALSDFVANAGIPGASKNTANAVLFWENDAMNFRLSYKTRSEYYKPFRVSSLRYTKAQDFLDFSASFNLTDSLVLRLQALNLLDEPNVFTRPTNDSLAETTYSGTRYFVGLRAKF